MVKEKGRSSKTSKKKTPRWLRTVGLHLAAMVLFIAVVVIVAWQGLLSCTQHGKEVVVPNVKGLPFGAAEYRLREVGLRAEVRDSVYVATMAPNLVCEQSLSPGSPVKKDRTIYLTINSGSAPLLSLPDVADNSSLREATMKLRSMGFTVSEPEYCSGEKDWVYEVKVGGRVVFVGSRLKRTDVVTLVVGDGTYEDADVENVGEERGTDESDESFAIG